MGEVHVVPGVRGDRRDEIAPRCPYCREDVRLEGDAPWTACALCLARHHTGCWDELTRCASCGDATRLTPVVPPPERVPGALGWLIRALDLAHRVTGIVLGGMGLVGSLFLLLCLLLGPADSLAEPSTRLFLLGAMLGFAATLGVGLGLRAASLRWMARPRARPWPLLAVVVGLGLAPTLGFLLGDQPVVAGVCGALTVAWAALVAGAAAAGARRLIAADRRPPEA